MILGISEILRLVREKNLVEGLTQRELESPEGAGFDLRLGAVSEVVGPGFLGVTERETPGLKEIACWSPDKSQTIELQPNVYYLMQTVERVNTPIDMMVLFRPRTTLFRSGVALLTGNCSPGYCGELNFGMINLRSVPFRLELGARVVHAMFYQVDGETAPYRGQWQGGRQTTTGRETQV